MKTRNLFATAALICAATTFTACNVNDNIVNNDQAAVRFTAGIENQTATAESRATGTSWTDGDQIGIRMIGGSGATVGTYANQLYTTTAAGNLTAEGADMYYPMDGSTVNFIAYYPYAALTGNTYSVSIETSQTAASQPAFDLLWVKTTTGYSKNSSSVGLQFAHKLSKLEMTAVNGTGVSAADLAAMTVAIKGMNTTASFDIAAGTFSGAAAPATITPLTVTDGALYEAIILPMTTGAAGDVYVEFTINPITDPETFTWKVPASTSFDGGYVHKWTITLSRTAVTGIQGSITPWTESTSGSGTAE